MTSSADKFEIELVRTLKMLELEETLGRRLSKMERAVYLNGFGDGSIFGFDKAKRILQED